MDSKDFGKSLPHPVLLAGGVGTRLWPLSTTEYPKQFVKLLGEHSLFQQTALRYTDRTRYESMIVVTGEKYESLVGEQMQEILPELEYHIFTEKQRRDTAPAIAAITQNFLMRGKDSVLLVVPSDHHIGDMDNFHQAIERGMPHAEKGIVIFGIEPTSYETGYGYIKQGKDLGDKCYKVAEFKEKPDLKTAIDYIDGSDRFTWNSGIYMFSTEAMRKAFRLCAREIFYSQDPPSMSIDVAISQPYAEKIVVVETEMAWNDVGSWSGVKDVLSGVPNSTECYSRSGVDDFENSSGCLSFAKTPTLFSGCKNLGLVETEDSCLLLLLSSSQKMKQIASSEKRLVSGKDHLVGCNDVIIKSNKKFICVDVENITVSEEDGKFVVRSC